MYLHQHVVLPAALYFKRISSSFMFWFDSLFVLKKRKKPPLETDVVNRKWRSQGCRDVNFGFCARYNLPHCPAACTYTKKKKERKKKTGL